MNKSTIISLTLLISFIVAGCSSIEIFKENTEFKPYVNYQSFVIINKEVGQKGFNDELLDAKVIDEIQYRLESLGLKYNREKPELIIRYTSNEDVRQKEIYPNQYPFWGWRAWDPFLFDPRFMQRQQMNSTKNYELLQVIVDFIDPKNDKMLMRLTAVSEVYNEKEKQKKVIKSVQKIIETYQLHLSQINP
ncbi:MAG: DUF4136 domain-containing protein [Cyclobacteriaceae bacterium]|nr:DUF4136 domain-containing protein [Cyclobacteriaceae bacterium]